MSATAVSGCTRLHAGIDALRDARLDTCTDAEVLDVWQALEVARRRLDTLEHAVISEVQTRSLAFTHGCRSTADLGRQLLHLSPGEARARVAAAQTCGPQHAVTGEALPPIHPVVAAAHAEGAISAAHARVIVAAVAKLPDEIAAELDRTVEQLLVYFAREHDPLLLKRHADQRVYALDQDGQYRDLAYCERHRFLDVHHRADGSAYGSFDLSAECGEHLRVMLDTLARPMPAEDGLPDPRTPGQRRHDALHEWLNLVERARLLPDCAGTTATLVLTMDADAYATGMGTARTGHGYPVPADISRQWAGPDARAIAVLLSTTKAITEYSSVHRLFTEQQRLALHARDRGCSFPGCDAPPGYTQVHHVEEFQAGGPSTVANGTLVCGFHHRNFAAMGWQCTMRNGAPHWTPPKWLDPEQTPIRNRMHDY
jgi:hypothetical protein